MQYSQPHITRSNAILDFLRQRPLLSRNGLCKLVGYDVSNLQKMINNTGLYKKIPEQYLDSFEKQLAPYGFLPTTNNQPPTPNEKPITRNQQPIYAPRIGKIREGKSPDAIKESKYQIAGTQQDKIIISRKDKDFTILYQPTTGFATIHHHDPDMPPQKVKQMLATGTAWARKYVQVKK